ncbi:MAG: family 1 glycosylhydrolase, partial [Halanaerobium sp.]
PIEKSGETEKDQIAVDLMDQYKNRWFLDPVFKGEYPNKLYNVIREKFGNFEKGHQQISTSCRELDFLGINYYSRTVVKYNENELLKAEAVKPEGSKYTHMEWEEHSEGLYKLLKRVNEDYGDIPLYITENGAAYQDKKEKDGIHDQRRIDYLKNHFLAAQKSIEDGLPLKGYYIWTLMDNFEWAYGYNKRFGVIYIDYENDRNRILKDSALLLKDVIENNGLKK